MPSFKQRKVQPNSGDFFSPRIPSTLNPSPFLGENIGFFIPYTRRTSKSAVGFQAVFNPCVWV